MDAIVDVVCGDQRACSGGRADARPTAFRFVAADERRALGISSHWPFESWGRFLPEHTTAVSLLDRPLLHANVVVTDGDSYRMRQARARERNHPEQDLIYPRGGDFYLATSGDKYALGR